MARFIDVFEDVTRKGTKISTNLYLENGQYPIIDQGQSEIAGYTNEKNGLFADVPAIIFGDHTRIVKYIDSPCFLGADGVKLLKAKDTNANYKYLYYALCNVDIPDTGYNRHFKWLKEIDLPDHTAEEQRKIVDQLEDIDSLISLRKQQLSKLDELVKARFVELFGDLRINEKEWDIKTFSELAEIITDGEHSTPRRVEKGIYLLSARNVLNHSLQLDDVDYIDEDEYSRISKRIIPRKGDVLISCSGTVGRCCSVPDDLKFQMVRSVAIVRFKNIINPIFAEYMITSDYLQEQINGSKTMSSQANLFQGKIAKLRGFVPPIELQEKFVSFVEQTDKSKLAIQKSLEKLETMKKALMQKYFG